MHNDMNAFIDVMGVVGPPTTWKNMEKSENLKVIGENSRSCGKWFFLLWFATASSMIDTS